MIYIFYILYTKVAECKYFILFFINPLKRIQCTEVQLSVAISLCRNTEDQKNCSNNPEGLCSYQTCHDNIIVESPEHILHDCPAYSMARSNMVSLSLNVQNAVSKFIVINILVRRSRPELIHHCQLSSAMPNMANVVLMISSI